MTKCRLCLFSMIVLSMCIFYNLESFAVPPHPEVYGVKGGSGIFAVEQALPGMTESLSSPLVDSTSGTQEIVVILVEFPDVTHDPAHDSAHFHNLFFSESNQRSMYSYYNQASYGQMSISGVITGWYRSNYDMSYYGADGYKIDRLNGSIYELAREAVTLADAAGFDFSQYDNDNNGYIDHIMIVHAGPAQETGGRSYGPNAIWSHHWSIWPREQVDGVQAGDYSMIAEFSPMGTAAHEFGHDLGVPDLYDKDGSSGGIGAWGIMALGAWQLDGDVPAQFCAWSKTLLGWIEPKVVNADEINITLDAVENSNFDTVIKIPLAADEYFLLENRQKTGFDQYLPGDGLLIWHIDDSVGNIDLNDVNDDEYHKRVDMEEADGRDDLDRNANSGDYTDPYYLNNNALFDDSTVPDSGLCSGESSGVRVLNISDSGVAMTLSISFSANLPPVADAGGPYTGEIHQELMFDGSGSFDSDGDPLEYRWDFDADDGIQVDSTEEDPTHEYSAAGTYNVTLIASDGELDSEPSTATVEVIYVQQMALDLAAGWNLISLYLQPNDTRLSSVLFSIEGKYDSIWAYDAITDQWRRNVIGAPLFLNDLEEMEAHLGYWTMMNQPATLIVQGSLPESAISLKAGWNLVGHNYQDQVPLDDYLSILEDNFNSIWTYDAIAGEWLKYYSSGPAFLNDLEYLEPGNGYWIEVNEDCIWDIDY